MASDFNVVFYSLGFLVAIPTLLLLWELFIWLRLYYGDFRVNKLTFHSLKWALALLLSNLINYIVLSLAFIYDKDLILANESLEIFYKSWLFRAFILPVTNIFIFTSSCFLASLIKENFVLVAYILFQKIVAFNQIDQQRSQYNRIEGWIDTIFTYYYTAIGASVTIESTFFIILGFIPANETNNLVTVLVWSYFPLMFFWSLFGFASLGVTIHLMFAMKQHQNFEYHLHRSRLGFKSLAVISTLFVEVGLVWFSAFIFWRIKTNSHFFTLPQVMSIFFLEVVTKHINNVWLFFALE